MYHEISTWNVQAKIEGNVVVIDEALLHIQRSGQFRGATFQTDMEKRDNFLRGLITTELLIADY